jgi:signal transduction histidine kinase
VGDGRAGRREALIGVGRRRGLRVRAGLAMALTSLVLSASLALLAYSLVRRTLIDQRESTALRQAYTNARVVRSTLRSADPDLAGVLAGLQVGGAGGNVVVAPGGTFSSSVDVNLDDLPVSLTSGVTDGRAGHQRISIGDEAWLVTGVPIAEAGAGYYEVTSFDEIDRTLDTLASSLAFGAAATAVVGGVLGAAMSVTVLRPLREVADVAHRIVGGKLDARLDAGDDRDLAPLADAFNEMLDELRTRIERETRFASDVAHELRGPLTVLASAVEVVERRRSQLLPELVEAVDALDAQVGSFNRLVLDLLEISRFEAGAADLNLRVVDLEELVGAAVAEREPPRPEVRRKGPEGLRVEVDPRRIQQVLANLLDNADRYAGGATCVTVEQSPGGALRMLIDDDGPGVPDDDRERIFQRFTRGRALDGRDHRGSGLGLALCRNHIGLHGGRISVGASPSGGARFVVELPQRQP